MYLTVKYVNMPQISATVTHQLINDVSEIAKRDNRTFSQTVSLLLQLAVKEKNRKRKVVKQNNS